jgi:DNA-binding transcriptional regulator/RsmH inhibitor MraZ
VGIDSAPRLDQFKHGQLASGVNSVKPIRLGVAQAKALLARLRKDEGTSYLQETCRLYFVDVDVLSSYINGANRNILSDWSSFFSLTHVLPESDKARVDQIEHSLADAVAKSVSGFLLGRFRESRSMQNGRLWLTPEHSRELDSMVHAVLQGQLPALGDWQKSLFEQYMALSANDKRTRQDTERQLESIFLSLRENAPGGKVGRAYGARRRFTNVLTQLPVFPPHDLSPAFLMRCDTPGFERRFKKVAEFALDDLLERTRMAQHSPDYWPAIEYLRRSVFAAYPKKVFVADQIRHAVGNEVLLSLIPERTSDKIGWIRLNVLRAINSTTDVYALARIITLAEFLRDDHQLALPFEWRVCLISGSSMMQDLLEGLRQHDLGTNVELVHPLSAMRFDEFLRPISQQDDTESPGDVYALAVLGDPDGAAEKLDEVELFRSLNSLLTQASAALAFQHDRALHKLHENLKSEGVSYNRIVRAVGNAVSSEFIHTYLQVNRMVEPGEQRLPSVSLPWINLPLPNKLVSAAEQWVKGIHNQSPSKRSRSTDMESGDLNEVLQADLTGYTACVCASLGYLTMDREHLQSAEVAANTAVRTASISSDDSELSQYVPEGNEALYLAAFVSRMRVSAKVDHRRAALEWRALHSQVMTRAYERCSHWEQKHPDLASRQNDPSGLVAIELIRLRYGVEDAARQVVCMLIDQLETNQLDGVQFEAMWLDSSSALVNDLSKIVQRIRAGSRGSPDRRANTELGFVGAQLSVALIQFWIFERIRAEQLGQHASEVTRQLDSLIGETRALVPSHDSALLQGLNTIFNKHCLSPRSAPEPTRRDQRVVYTKFAAIDDLRAPFLTRVERLERGMPLGAALPGHMKKGDTEGIERSRA